MDPKNSLALKKKRELLGGINKRKMSLRKHMDNLKQNECRLDITQITKCVFLGSLCLKPVPQLFDSPSLLEELDMRVGNVKSDIISINNENEEKLASGCENNDIAKDSFRKGTRKKCLNVPKIKKKSLRERNESRTMNGIYNVIKNENVALELRQSVKGADSPILISSVDDDSEVSSAETSFQKDEPRVGESFTPITDNNNKELSVGNSFQKNINIKENSTDAEINKITTSETFTNEQLYDFENELLLEQNMLGLKLDQSRKASDSGHSTPEDVPPDIKTVNSLPLNYDDVERLKREPTPELILSDSDEDAIDQLMFNIMDIKVGPVGPNDFEKSFEIPSSDVQEYDDDDEYSKDFSVDKDFTSKEDNNVSKDKKFIKRNPQCKICSQAFSNYIQLKKHKLTHNGDKPYLCLKCNENHTTLDELLAHLRTHQGKRPYVCKKCNKGFRTTKALENHQPVHVLRKVVPQKKGFKCEVCGKEFRKLCDLERHTRVHTGEKPSVCNICNRRFQQAHNLNKHLLIHTKEKPFECDICHKKFGRNDVLNRHLLTHSVKKPNICNICMKSFIRASQLLAHKEKYHSDETS